MDLIKKLKNYAAYRAIVKERADFLAGPLFAIRTDMLRRMYTVINIPEDVVAYGPGLVESTVSEYIMKVMKTLDTIGLFELVSVYTVQKLDERNYLVVFGYRFMDPRDIAAFIKYTAAALIGTAAIAMLLHFLSTL